MSNEKQDLFGFSNSLRPGETVSGDEKSDSSAEADENELDEIALKSVDDALAAGAAVQPVDVLRDQRVDLARRLESCQ